MCLGSTRVYLHGDTFSSLEEIISIRLRAALCGTLATVLCECMCTWMSSIRCRLVDLVVSLPWQSMASSSPNRWRGAPCPWPPHTHLAIRLDTPTLPPLVGVIERSARFSTPIRVRLRERAPNWSYNFISSLRNHSGACSALKQRRIVREPLIG